MDAFPRCVSDTRLLYGLTGVKIYIAPCPGTFHHTDMPIRLKEGAGRPQQARPPG